MEMSPKGPAGACRVLRDLDEKLLPFSVRTMDSLRNSLIGAILWRGRRRWHFEFKFWKDYLAEV